VTTRGITVAGKAAPESDELEWASDRGFDDIELYLERTHLTDVDRTVDVVEAAPVDVVSVHTPHVTTEELEWVQRADRLADSLDAYLVVHSKRIIHAQITALEPLDLRAPHGFENNPGASERHLRSMILDRGHEFVLDTAHLYMADADYLATAERLLAAYGDRIRVVHLCDSTRTEDGLGFGKGSMDMAALSRLIRQHFEGLVVLEVMPEEQADAKERFETY
jgi:sugar phosphate isomerase/epimerase